MIVHRSSGHDELDVAARDAVLAAKFLPFVENGRPRSAHVIIPIDFSLSVRTAARS
ncbi:MAG: TonB family protein [Sphingomonas sp.]|nr:MAG: TonB family protein [Sphingomonas sp.]